MCGIAGLFDLTGCPIAPNVLAAMNAAMFHRGPDAGGLMVLSTADGAWQMDERAAAGMQGNLGFAHRRLSILDLSDAGRQPMSYAEGRLWLTFNGEIYNFRELREELQAKGYAFQSATDTEVILAGYHAWGLDVLERLNGMFALALWDQDRQRLLLARDRLGIKPLYYHLRDGALAFASEIKPLLVSGVPVELDVEALNRYLSFLWVPDPDTMFKGVLKLPPGHSLVIEDGCAALRSYWNVAFDKAPGDEDTLVAAFQSLLEDSVRLQMRSDVPVGAFLSGGLDSSAILAYMKRFSDRQPTTYTVGYSPRDLRYDIVPDDVRWARRVGKLFDVDYHEMMLEPRVVDLLPKIVWHMEEPVADPAAISTYLICEAARKKLTVMLSGMGGDEILAGYPRHRAVRLADWYQRVPAGLRSGLVEPLMARLPASVPGPFNALFRNSRKLLRDASQPFRERYMGYGTYFTEPEKPRLLSDALAAAFREGEAFARHQAYFDEVAGADPIDQMAYIDLKTFLPCLNLTYSDKMSMAHSLEMRVPLLDHRLVEFSAALPPDLKLHGLTSKYLFKRAMEDVLPKDVIYRKKAGFGAPIRAWLAQDLREMIGDLLSEETLKRRGLFRPEGVQKVLADLWSGREDNALKVWQLLTLELWQQAFVDRSSLDFAVPRHEGIAS